MATGYSGYVGYGDPERVRLERQRQLAETLMAGASQTGPKNLAQGLSQLGQAFLAKGATDKADAAESAYATSKARRLAQIFNPGADDQGRNMAPDVNVSADPAPAPAQADPRIRSIAAALGGVYEGDGKTQPMGMTAAPMADVGVAPAPPPGGQMPSAPTQGENIKALATTLAPVETGMPGPGQISMSEPVSMPMTAAQMPKAAPDEVALLQQAMRITGGDLMQARALVESKLAPARSAEALRYARDQDAAAAMRAAEQAATQAAQWQANFDQGVDEFGNTFGETVRSNRAGEALEGRKLAAEASTAGMPDFGDENGFTNQYLGQAKTFQAVRDAQSRIQAVGSAKNPAEQMSLIFGYMKMLDPGSTVREGEYATAQNTTGLPGWITNAYNKAKDGVFLNDQQVKDFLGQANTQYKVAEENYVNTVLNPYRQRAPRYGMDPSIIQDFRLPAPQPKPSMAQQGINALGDAVKGIGGMFMQPGRAQPQPQADDLDSLVNQWLK